MLNIHTLTLGLYQVNCYIVHNTDSDRCVVIDPGYEPKKIAAFLAEKGLKLEAILLTHGHFDHVGGVKALAENAKVYLHDLERTMPQALTAGPLYATDTYPSRFEIAGMDFTVLHTPGHTPGSVCRFLRTHGPARRRLGNHPILFETAKWFARRLSGLPGTRRTDHAGAGAAIQPLFEVKL